MKCFAFFVPLLAVAFAEPGAPGLLARGAVGGYGARGLGARGHGGYGAPLLANNVLGGYAAGGYGAAPIAARGYAAAPVVARGYAAAPVVAPVVAKGYAAPAPAPKVVSNQYHKQDELGNYEYGYNNVNSARRESGNGYGGVTGSYTYVDSYGLPQRVDYIADDYGFRVTGTNIPKNAATTGLNIGGYGRHKRSLYAGSGLPAPVEAQRIADYGIWVNGGYGHGHGGYGGYGNNVRPAVLQVEKLNPGHAVAYRVY